MITSSAAAPFLFDNLQALQQNKTMERMTSVEVVVRDQVGPIANGLVPTLIESFLDCSIRWTIQRAACGGYLSLLRRLGKRKPEISEHGFDWSMRISATEGHLEIIKWLTAFRPELKVSTRVMDAAAYRGRLDVVKWLHENRSEGCSVHAIDSAAASGHLDVVKYLHDNRQEGCTTGAIDTAAAGGHLTTVQWLWLNRTEGCTSVAVDFARYNNHFSVVNWFSELAKFQPRHANRTGDFRKPSNLALHVQPRE